MNLLCPNCQKMLTVPEEYAGQLMQCPLCRGTFQMPAAPQPSGGATMPAPAPPSRPPAPPQDPFNIPVPPSGVYQMSPEPTTAPPPMPPGMRMTPPPPTREEYAPVEPLPDVMPPPTTPGEYRHAIPLLRFNPRYLQWIVVGALLVEFVLFFFPWVGLYPGGVGIATQTAWQAAFNGYSLDKDMGSTSSIPGTKKDKGPGINLLLIFYVILLCITLLLAIGSVVLSFLSGNLSPGLRTIKNLRWLIVGGVALLAFLLLSIQLLVGFSLEKKAWNAVEEKLEAKNKEKAATTDAETKQREMERGMARSLLGLRRTTWFRLAFVLQLLAVVCCFLDFWVSRRGNRPLPKLEFAW
jgi:hypothetical protein